MKINNTLRCNHKICNACYEKLETTTNACPICQKTLNSEIKIEKRSQEMTNEEMLDVVAQLDDQEKVNQASEQISRKSNSTIMNKFTTLVDRLCQILIGD